ncbi:hypothetical protein GWI33_007513 [Rhynchophorus ferrugineus]|uniref:Uncharacterized protein n=1 Tax=Rhynchophorus ferrugineus TaxID=354439 RepID=A0A834IHJ6_RHYFE|nr:hypothetical protein GWI33_007513 [Rhynchophorus ferrugineus]
MATIRKCLWHGGSFRSRHIPNHISLSRYPIPHPIWIKVNGDDNGDIPSVASYSIRNVDNATWLRKGEQGKKRTKRGKKNESGIREVATEDRERTVGVGVKGVGKENHATAKRKQST